VYKLCIDWNSKILISYEILVENAAVKESLGITKRRRKITSSNEILSSSAGVCSPNLCGSGQGQVKSTES